MNKTQKHEITDLQKSDKVIADQRPHGVEPLLLDALVAEQVDVDRVVPADRLPGKDPKFEPPTTGLVVEEVEVWRGPDQDDDVADLDDAARQLAVEFHL